MQLRIDPAIVEAVRADGQPRETLAVEYDDAGRPTGGSETVMVFRDGATVRSIALADYPTEAAQIAARDEGAAQLRQAVVTTAQSAVGVRFDQLTAAQVRALAAILFWREGALDNQGVVRPLVEWVKP